MFFHILDIFLVAPSFEELQCCAQLKFDLMNCKFCLIKIMMLGKWGLHADLQLSLLFRRFLFLLSCAQGLAALPVTTKMELFGISQFSLTGEFEVENKITPD